MKNSEMGQWMNSVLPQITDTLEKCIIESRQIHMQESLNLSGRNTIYSILNDILTVLLPGVYAKEKIDSSDLNFFIGDMLRHITFELKKIIKENFDFHCESRHNKPCHECDCEMRSQQVCKEFIESLPEIRRLLLDDIEAAFEGDPAVKSRNEIILAYPCVEAIATYRIAHRLFQLEIPIIPRIMSEHAHSKTGIDIHPGASIGSHFFIDHGTGVVIGETTTIGKNVKIYQGVTLGALSPFDKQGKPKTNQKRHPNIEDDVIIYANATILGGTTTIGKGSIIGGNTWITKSVEPGSVVYSK